MKYLILVMLFLVGCSDSEKKVEVSAGKCYRWIPPYSDTLAKVYYTNVGVSGKIEKVEYKYADKTDNKVALGNIRELTRFQRYYDISNPVNCSLFDDYVIEISLNTLTAQNKKIEERLEKIEGRE